MKNKIFLSLLVFALLVNCQKDSEDCFSLLVPLEFGNKPTGKIKIDKICKSKIDEVLATPIYGENDSGSGVEVGSKFYKNCQDGFDFSATGLYAETMKDIFNSQCDLPNKIATDKIKKAKSSNLKDFDLTKLNQIPAGLFLAFVTPEKEEEFKKSPESEKKLSEITSNPVTSNAILEFEWNNTKYNVKEVLRADFNDDGIEDILLFIDYEGFNGAFKGHKNIVITKIDEFEPLSIISIVNIENKNTENQSATLKSDSVIN